MKLVISNRVKTLFSLLFFSLLCNTAIAFELITVKVTKDVYALIGETGPRTYENHALNNNIGFIITKSSVILIDSGASPSAAKLIEQSILKITDKPVKWVINTGSQDHRWLGNSYFAQKGAEVIALKSTVDEQKKHETDHIDKLKNTLRENADVIRPVQADRILVDESNNLILDNIKLQVKFLGDSHFPGDGIVWLPSEKIVFTGDLVYVDRMLGIQSYSPVVSWLQAFNKMMQLKAEIFIPGHGTVSSAEKVQQQTGDYLDYLISGVKKAQLDWVELDDTVTMLTKTAGAFKDLENFDSWHKLNINRTYLQLEAAQ